MTTIKHGGTTFQADKVPSICPHCHHNMVPSWKVSAHRKNNDWIDVAYTCVHPDCGKMFVASYNKSSMRSETYYLKKLAPTTFLPPTVSDDIQTLSPSFYKIYSQATQAESIGLDEIAGVGYRKALEFLIKDFCINQSPDKEAEIKEKFLGKVINECIADPNILNCSKRAVWLGNDETHYVRKWSDKDISDLKILIKLTCGWIDNNLLTQKYLAEME